MVDHWGPRVSSQLTCHGAFNALADATCFSGKLLRPMTTGAGWIAVQVAVLVVVTAMVRVMT